MRYMKLFSMICLLILIGVGVVSAETPIKQNGLDARSPSAVTAVLMVDNDGDSDTILPGVTCVTGIPNDCSLRQAILVANDTAGLDIIRFDLTLYPGEMTIAPNSPLPEITRPVEIDGVTGTGGSCPTTNGPANLPVILDGVRLSSGSGLFLHMANPNAFNFTTSNGSTIRGLNIINFPSSGILVEDTRDHTIVCNHLGLDRDGNEAGNTFGVTIQDFRGDDGDDEATEDNLIGGTAVTDRNIISGNNRHGVRLYGEAVVRTTIEGNIIGLDPTGIFVRRNGENGVELEGSSHVVRGNIIAANGEHGIATDASSIAFSADILDNTIGLDVNGVHDGNVGDGIAVEGNAVIISNNTIATNGGNGIALVGSSVDVTNNRVGLSADGNSPLGNNGDGIIVDGNLADVLDNLVSDNGGDGIIVIGDDATIDGNEVGLVGGNDEDGIEVNGDDATINNNVSSDNGLNGMLINGDDAFVTDNYIGTTATGNGALGNGRSGINVQGFSNFIGGGTTQRNIIGDNSWDGITIIGRDTSDTTVIGNYIGVSANGTTALGNADHGVAIKIGANNNRVGQLGSENVIFNNGLTGIMVSNDDSVNNELRHNFISDNGSLGIDHLATGEAVGEVTWHDQFDADSGPNNLQNWMYILTAESSGRITGNFTGIGFQSYTFDIYQVDRCDGSGYGEGGDNLIATFDRNVVNGNLAFDEIITPAPPLGSYLIALVTDANGNTSEFGNCRQIVEAEFVVDSTADYADNNAGDGICESAVTNVCTLRAAIEEANALGGGPYNISFNLGVLGFVQPIELDSALPTITTPVTIDASTMTDAACPTGNSAANHRVILDGTNVTSGDGLRLADTASGSTIRGFRIRNFPDSGIRVDGDDNVIACNTLNNNTLHGVNVTGDDNRIGGTARSERNVIVSNDKWGVRLGNSATLNKVQGNYVGVEGDGTTSAGNGDSGVFLSGGSMNRIGGSVGFAANVISANGVHGIEIDGGSTSNQIWGNIIGLDASGSTALGNTNSGIYVNGANSNDIGDADNGKGNIISANEDDGIFLNSNSNFVQGNFIGTDINGLVDLGNGSMGIRIVDGDTNVIGGDNAVDGNVIAGNDSSGVYVSGHAVGTTIRHNSIGVNVGGNALGNTGNGVGFAEQVSQALVRDNSIAHNGKDGIAATETVILSNFAANEIYENGELGIDLNNDGVVNANDNGDGDSGGNGLMNYPVILGAHADNNEVTIFLNSLAARDYRIHVYRNRSCDPSGYGEGERYLGSFDVTMIPGNPTVQETAVLPKNFNAGDQITATATPLTSPIADGTSEFSACFTATGSTTQTYSWGEQEVGFVVNTTSGMQPAIDSTQEAWSQGPWVDCPTCKPATMHLLPFKESANHLGRTNNGSLLGSWLRDFEAVGGSTCADATFAGLREFGTNLSDESAPVSDAVVFSDSPPAGNRRTFGLLLDQLIDRGIQVHNVGRPLCNDTNLPDHAMNYLALLTGGEFHSPASAAEYKIDAQIAMNLAMSQDMISSHIGKLNNSIVTFPIEVDSSFTTLGLSYRGECLTCTEVVTAPQPHTITGIGDISVELINPDGDVIDSTTPGYQHLSTSTRGMQMLFETVPQSDAGTWQVRVSGDGDYSISVVGNSSVHMTSIGQHTARVNKPFQVGAFITVENNSSCGNGCRPKTATLKLIGLDNQEIIPVYMSNNSPSTSVFRGSVTVATPGLYRLAAEGELENGTKFMRVDPTPIRVRAHSLSGPGNKSALPGSTKTISFELVNDGGFGSGLSPVAATTFDLEMSSELGWTETDLIPDSATLRAGESATYTVDVVVPSDAEIGLIEKSVFVAVPQDDLGASVSVSTKTSVVDQMYVFLPAILK